MWIIVGGVFLGVALLDMLPEALCCYFCFFFHIFFQTKYFYIIQHETISESFEDFKRAAEFDTDVPVVPIVIGNQTINTFSENGESAKKQ